MERRFSGKELGWELSTPSPKGLRRRSDISTATSSESDRGPETWQKKLRTRHDRLLIRGVSRGTCAQMLNLASMKQSAQVFSWSVSFEGTVLPRGYVEGW